MTVLQISPGQKNQLLNRKLIAIYNWFFNPLQDTNNKWFISHEERNQVLDKQGIGWIDSLTEIEFE
jgi:hypothetical protein